jgi:hypothetical protein
MYLSAIGIVVASFYDFDFGLVPTVWYSLFTFNHHMNIYVCIGGS